MSIYVAHRRCAEYCSKRNVFSVRQKQSICMSGSRKLFRNKFHVVPYRLSGSLMVIGTDTDWLATCERPWVTLKQLDPRGYDWLADFFTKVSDESQIPRIWRQAKVMALEKPGKINGDFSRKLQNFPTPVYLTPRLGGSPWNIVTSVVLKKLVVPLAEGGRSLTLCAFVSIQCHSVTDGRTDGRTDLP